MNELRAFWSRIAPRYDSVVDLQIGANTRAVILERLGREEGLGTAVEFGCGTGFYTAALADKAESLLATDLAPGMLALARQRISARNVEFREEDCQKTSLPDAGYDTVFLSLVLHFTDPAKTLLEMRRILKPSGRLLISNLDPDALSPINRLRCRMRVLYYGVTRHRRKPPRNFGRNTMRGTELCERLAEAGFKVLSMECFKSPSNSSNVPIEFVKAVKV